MTSDTSRARFQLRRFLIPAAIGVGVLIGLHLLQPLARMLLVLFVAMLFGVFLDAAATGLVERTRMRRGLALGLAAAGVIAIPVLAGWLIGPKIGQQVSQLVERLPEVSQTVEEWLATHEWGRRLIPGGGTGEGLSFNLEAVRGITGFFTTIIGGVVSFFIIIFVGIWLAVEPRTYACGLMKLVPLSKRDRAWEVLSAVVRMLRRWLIGRIAAMVFVGGLVTLGLSIAGVPFPWALGFIAAVLEFVPYIGPFAAAIPGILIALGDDPIKAIWAVLVYIIVQSIEGSVVTPLIERRAVSLGPAFIISSQIIMGVLYGSLGVLVATPLAAVVIITVQMLYIEDTLGDPVTVLGESHKVEEERCYPSDRS
ncbi:MAG: AI-2E family transporter [Candidatus Eisenbacteria bacterium]|nr:AI-2E family transporter [Candidatus Eisenbacteria bacterium]